MSATRRQTEPTTDALHAIRLVGSTSNHEDVRLFEEVDLATSASEFVFFEEATADPFLLGSFASAAANDQTPPIEHTSIDSLGEAGYESLQPIPVEIRRVDVGDYEAWFREANIAIAGTDGRDALQALVAEILDTFDLLLTEPDLGPDAVEQLRILHTYIART